MTTNVIIINFIIGTKDKHEPVLLTWCKLWKSWWQTEDNNDFEVSFGLWPGKVHIQNIIG